MSQVEKLDLMGVSSLAVVSAALLMAWMATTPPGLETPARHAAQESAVTLTDDGRMKLTVTVSNDAASQPARAATRTASVRPTRGPSIDVALPLFLRP